MHITRISQKMKKINWLSIAKKNYRTRKKTFIIIIRKYFNVEKYANFLFSGFASYLLKYNKVPFPKI